MTNAKVQEAEAGAISCKRCTGRFHTIDRCPLPPTPYEMTRFKFNTREQAQAFAGRAPIAMRVMLGDDSKFWVVSPALAWTLEAQGYEYAA